MAFNPRPVRRSQLITTYGVGALHVTNNNVSQITMALDYWYNYQYYRNRPHKVEEEAFYIHDPRLESIFNLSELRLPPDYRESFRNSFRGGDSNPNEDIKIPSQVFPTWFVCNKRCFSLKKYDPTFGEYSPKCNSRTSKGEVCSGQMSQVQFITICEDGHLNEFPWLEWVHRTDKVENVSCGPGNLKLRSTGSIIDSVVECSSCLKSNKMTRTRYLDDDGISSVLSGVVKCKGSKPWIHNNYTESCDKPHRSAFRSEGNVYFANVMSSILLPSKSKIDAAESIMRQDPTLSVILGELFDIAKAYTPEKLKDLIQSNLLNGYSDSEIQTAFNRLTDNNGDENIELNSTNSDFRYTEYNYLINDTDEDELNTKKVPMELYSNTINSYFTQITEVPKITETRALVGFSRLLPKDVADRSILWKTEAGKYNSWLPANVVKGEGIFFEFNQNKLDNWAQQSDITNRLNPLMERYSKFTDKTKRSKKNITDKFLLLHTFAHFLIEELCFECGYSAASLRERIYVSEEPDTKMAGVMIYTANSDSEGSLGGLVRMASPDRIEPVLKKIIAKASWCSNDPVCMEHGSPDLAGQGTEGLNLASCYACSLISETSCEEFNIFLDRAMLIGDHNQGTFEGFFHDIINH
jgi:hypothetical protein